jgi:hypothetical protein
MNYSHRLSLLLTPASFFILPVAIASFKGFNSEQLLVGGLAMVLLICSTLIGLREFFKEESSITALDRDGIRFRCFLEIACLSVGTGLFCVLSWLPV